MLKYICTEERYLITDNSTLSLKNFARGDEMPSKRFHERVDKLVLGESFPDVHEAIDDNWKLYGVKHRRTNHTYSEAMRFSGKERQSAFLHIFFDRRIVANIVSLPSTLREYLEEYP